MNEEQENKLLQATKTDTIYQQLLKQCMALEEDYLSIKVKLPYDDQDALDRYLAMNMAGQ